jgi:arylsulfatase A-like enzyme/Flp pilus assembly protein TadD
MKNRKIIIVAGVILIGVLIWLLFLRQRKDDRPNLLLITMDTTRADHLGSYGYNSARTPALDKLARSGVKFNRFFANVPLTLPSHTTMMTGLYPPEHGCRVNGEHKLGEEITTMGEVFSRNGYRTGAFVAAFVLDSQFGLDRGFDTYNDYDVPTSNDIYDDNAMYRYRRADRVADAALEWLDEQTGGPFFCWVHFFDPHHPYYFRPADGRGIEDSYNQEIAFMDTQINRLIGFLKDRGLDKKTTVIAVGDHGEGLGDHGEDEHGLLLYNPVVRVPLIISTHEESLFSEQKDIDLLLSTVDLFPSILEIFGWEPPDGISGQSFAEVLQGILPTGREVYLETEFPFTEYGWNPLASLISGNWKYISAPREELYNLENDPAEIINLAEVDRGRTRRLKDRLTELKEKMNIVEATDAELDEKSRLALESLGYLGGSSAKGSSDSPLRDPKDAIGLRSEFISILGDINSGELTPAEERLRSLISKSPESYTFHYKLALLLFQQEQYDKARAEFRKLADRFPDEYKTHYNLGKTLIKLGRNDEAINELQIAITLDDEKTPAYNNLGIALLKTNRIEEAIDAFNRSVEIDYSQVDPHNNLGNAYLTLGRVSDATTEFKQSVEIDPDFFEGRYNLGLCLMRLGKSREATGEFREALRIRPDFLPAREQLNRALRAK